MKPDELREIIREELKPVKDDIKQIRKKMKEMATKDGLKTQEESFISAVNETSGDAIQSNERRIDKLERHTSHPPLPY